MTKIREVLKAYCAIEKDGKILLVKEVNESKWKFPGGHLEGVESEERGVAREVLEETGLQIKVGEIFFVEDYFHPIKVGERHSVTFFKAEVVGGDAKPQTGEIENLSWFTMEELRNLKSEEFDQKHQSALKNYLK